MATDPTTTCLQCGKTWLPSMDERTDYPGSGCDTGECICIACENRDHGECHFHAELREERERSEPPAPSPRELMQRLNDFHRATQERAVQAIEQSVAIMARYERMQSPAFPTNKLLSVAQCLVLRLQSCREAVVGLEGGAPMAEAFEQLVAHAQELLDLLQVGTFEAGKFPANDLFLALSELPEAKRTELLDVLRYKISSHLYDCFQAFWCAQ